jgi:hypothetical protein
MWFVLLSCFLNLHAMNTKQKKASFFRQSFNSLPSTSGAPSISNIAASRTFSARDLLDADEYQILCRLTADQSERSSSASTSPESAPESPTNASRLTLISSVDDDSTAIRADRTFSSYDLRQTKPLKTPQAFLRKITA